eukprot:5484573-Amphidinium_carterae.1
MADLEMLSRSATTWKRRYEYTKVTTVRSTRRWRERWQIWETPMASLGMLSDSATTWRGHCKS